MNEALKKGWVHPHLNETQKEQFERVKHGVPSAYHTIKRPARPSVSVRKYAEPFKRTSFRHIASKKGEASGLTNHTRLVLYAATRENRSSLSSWMKARAKMLQGLLRGGK